MQEINAAYEQIQNPGQRNTSYDQMQHSTNSYQSGGYQYKGYGTGQQEQEYGDFDPLEIFSHWSNYRSTKRRPIFLYILIGYLLLNLLFSLLGGGRTRQEYYYPYRYQEITIQNSSNMSREEIDRAVFDAQQYVAEDARSKDEATAKDTLEQLIYRAESSKNQLDKEQRGALEEAIKRAKKYVKQKDVQTMLDCAAELERLLPNQQ